MLQKVYFLSFGSIFLRKRFLLSYFFVNLSQESIRQRHQREKGPQYIKYTRFIFSAFGQKVI
jgi:hypothetical protein